MSDVAAPGHGPDETDHRAAGAAPPLELAQALGALGIAAEIVAPGVPMPTVETAARAMGVEPDRIFKSVLFQAVDGRCVMAVACGASRIDARRLAALAGTPRLRLASPEVVLAVTGYPAGGTPPVGYRQRLAVFVDTRVAAQPWGFAGGGREELLVRITPGDIVRVNGATVAALTLASA